MKKFLSLLLVAVMLLCSVSALADGIKLGQVQYAAHGTKCFAVLTVAMDGDTIVAAWIDEFQLMSAEEATGVPNTEVMFAEELGNGQVLASKRVNNDLYSANMAGHAGATQPLATSYEAIEAFVVGKTIAQVEAEIGGLEAAAVVDVVSGSTLVDTMGYINGLLAAARAAQ